MTVRQQKFLFTFSVLWMFGGIVLATIVCPAPTSSELPLVFGFSVASTLLPAFGLLALVRKLAGQQ